MYMYIYIYVYVYMYIFNRKKKDRQLIMTYIDIVMKFRKKFMGNTGHGGAKAIYIGTAQQIL